ncbi:PSD1 and planctomycete cytochrome C domain-containing protein [Calycomorphotria hydatis]|uniref:Planctomycete cytochrome C n=1 Tax=Calycomorphotria hydatis TaxID=2528027 RepID=A0A517T9S5_9PLAN|nr:PSD1 and planctomycete cytochrome C domain-containing protein [Calycomorphotria hydatis]QDT65127.1 Planctomycete cytochrome C [Calycomorphotria hydatis]
MTFSIDQFVKQSIKREALFSVCGVLSTLAILMGVAPFSCLIAGESQEVTERSADRIADALITSSINQRSPKAGAAYGWAGPWKLSSDTPAIIEETVAIRGNGKRNNPLRRKLLQPFQGDSFFVAFQFRYELNHAEAPDEPEFVVLWLDRLDGSDSSLHQNVANIGVNLIDHGKQRGKTLFMARTTPQKPGWTDIELVKGRNYHLVAQLTKSVTGPRNDYDQIKLWVNPAKDDYNAPAVTLNNQKNVNNIGWVGVATGLRTEAGDQIHVSNLVLSKSWSDVLSIAPDSGLSTAKSPSTGDAIVWDKTVSFKKDVFPILQNHCFDCHSGEYPDSGYRLDVRDEILGFSTGQPLVDIGNSHRSRLVEVLNATDDYRMPPDGPQLSQQEVVILRAWIDQGLAWDNKLLPAPQIETTHWAFQPINRPELPVVHDDSWIRTPVDAFVSARHSQLNLKPATTADRRVLVRRLYLDLIGLPPTPEQVESFLEDESPDAFERLVDELLDSPHYGERWGRYWLDLARWAESHGYQHDIPRPLAWLYRDYVINSFNADKPYNQFLREQIAGDELSPYLDENLIATGFLAAARISGNEMDKKLQRNDMLVDIVNNTTSAVLGLTLECAQCHNHKFEPLSQRDYYRFQAFFAQGQPGNLSLTQTPQADSSQLQSWLPKGAYQFLMREAKKKKLNPNNYAPHTWGYYSPVTGRKEIQRYPVVNRHPLPYDPYQLSKTDTRILVRGDVGSPGLPVSPGWPAILGETPWSFSTTPRQALADWLESPENTLVARVWVNRIWQYHFGRGIVFESSDFGTKGGEPTHPQLLDWLASELRSNGWSTKHIHRQIVNSSTYRQSSQNEVSYKDDPQNKYLSRWVPRRLEAEAIRDAILVATDELDRTIGGPSVPPHLEEQKLRRTIYLAQRRSEMPDAMKMFDAPDGIRSCSRREVSTVALQPLYLLNSDFVTSRAQRLSQAILEKVPGDQTAQVRLLFQKTLGRDPDQEELFQALNAISGSDAEKVDPEDSSSLHGYTRLTHAMLNLNEFIYIP